MEQRKKRSGGLPEENCIKNLLLSMEGCIFGIMVGTQLPKRYRESVFICCAWLGILMSSAFLLKSFAEKRLAKKEAEQEEGFIMRIVEEE